MHPGHGERHGCGSGCTKGNARDPAGVQCGQLYVDPPWQPFGGGDASFLITAPPEGFIYIWGCRPGSWAASLAPLGPSAGGPLARTSHLQSR